MHNTQKQIDKEVILSVGANDCRWEYYRSPGNGGQKKNKTDSAVRCTHEPSKAVAVSTDERSQWQNKKLAFKRMTQTKQFQTWMKIETAKRLRDADHEKREKERIERAVEKAMAPENITIQVPDGKGWKNVEEDYFQNETGI